MANFFAMTATDLLNPLVNLWNGFVYLLPGLVAALIILLIGYLIAWAIGRAIKAGLVKAGLNAWMKKTELHKTIGTVNLSSGIGEIIKWYIFIIFLQAAVDIVNLGTLSSLLQDFVDWLPHLIAAVIVLVAGLFVAHFVSLRIIQNTEMKGIKVLAQGLKGVIMFIIVVIAIDQVGIDVSFLKNGFLIILAGVVFGLALAFGLSFGLGAKEEAKSIARQVRKNL